MFLSARSPGSCQHLREYGLHLDGDRSGKMFLRAGYLPFVPHSQSAVQAIPRLCVSERNRAMLVRRRLSVIHKGMGNLIPGGARLTTLINVWNSELFSCYSMLRYIPPIRLHSCMIWRSCLAVPMQQAQMSVLI